jgi:hypothetical protein
VLFVLSADRPLTESEVRFLRYVRQWGKKVVFVVNKARCAGCRPLPLLPPPPSSRCSRQTG